MDEGKLKFEDYVEMFGLINDTRSTYERLKNNPEVVMHKNEARVWDQIFTVTNKLCEYLKKSEDIFFKERMFLLVPTEKKILKTEEMIKKKRIVDVVIKDLITELNDLFDQLDLLKIEDIFLS